MANNTTAKKAAGRKPATKPQVKRVDEPVMNEMIKTVQEIPVTKEVKSEKKVFKSDDMIPCKSIVAGQLGMFGIKTGIHYEWHGRGDVVSVEYQDLVAAIRNNKKHITEPYFIIEDEEFLTAFPQVEKIYGTMYSMEDLRDVFTYDVGTMKNVINSLPNGAKETIKNIASSLISSGMLDSINKIKTLDEIFDTNFMLMTELYK